MKNRTGHVAFAGVIIVVFVVLVGALGYTYIVNSNSQIAKNTSKAPVALVAPEIKKTTDLDAAAEVLDSAALDQDLSALDEVESQL